MFSGLCLHACNTDSSVFLKCQDAFYGTVVADPDIPALQVGEERPGHVGSVVGDGEDPVAALCFDRTAVICHELHHLLLVIPVERAVQEFRVRHDMSHEVLRIARVREVAPAFTCDVDLLASLLRLFQNSDGRASVGSRAGCHQACRAGADDYDMLFMLFLFAIVIHAHSIN